MKRTGWSLILVAAMLLTVTVVAQAQQEKKVARIGLLRFGSGDDDSRVIGPFREELRKLGWVEGTNILIDYRRAGRNRDRLREFADELVRTKVELIVVTENQ